jgi:hypothetical protein
MIGCMGAAGMMLRRGKHDAHEEHEGMLLWGINIEWGFGAM